MRTFANCATCSRHSALYRTWRSFRVRRDRKHSLCFACFRNAVNQYQAVCFAGREKHDQSDNPFA